ncbi:MAG: hypothetical protein HFE86_03780 [Clostridiales bacterium]|nr:hypothetical protein [Clostridiales bacterium]
MFAVLQPALGKPNRWRERLLAFGRPPVWIEEGRAGDIRFALLRARCKKGRLSWNRIRRAAGREAGRLLLPEGCQPPPGCGVCGYDNSDYRRILLQNAFFHCMASCEPRLLTVALVDWPARYCELAVRLLARAAVVRVLTDRTDIYEVYTERARAELGAGLIVTDDVGCLESAAAVLAPEGLTGRRREAARKQGGQALIRPVNQLFFSGRADGLCGMTMDGACIRLPEPYESALPAGIDRLDFAAALYDSARPKSLARMLPLYICKEGLRIPLETAAALTAQAALRSGGLRGG